jgi:cell division protein FtsB
MTKDEELEYLRQENVALREELRQVREQLKAVQDPQAKDSHNSSLPSSTLLVETHRGAFGMCQIQRL